MSVREEDRAALFAIADLWAIYLDDARKSLTYSLEHTDPDLVSGDSALVDALRGDVLAYCDWSSSPPEIRGYLEGLPACPPGLTWEWFTWTSDDWEYNGFPEFVGPLTEKCLALGTAVVSVAVDGDGFTLGFVEADKLDELLGLAAKAGVSIEVHRPSAAKPESPPERRAGNDTGAGAVARLADEFAQRLSAALAKAGFVAMPSDVAMSPDDDYRGACYEFQGFGLPGVVASVTMNVGRGRYGVVVVGGGVSIRSSGANAILREMPVRAWLDADDDDGLRTCPMDSGGFGEFRIPTYSGYTHLLGGEESMGKEVEWFIDVATGPALGWFSARDSWDKLISLARTNNPNCSTVSPRRFRTIVAALVAAERFEDAASLMDWYVRRGQFNMLDSAERADAFDRALSERFPRYRAARAASE